ncbi:hypothetical protein NFI96_024196, partial [Prochilodus magdalenae]
RHLLGKNEPGCTIRGCGVKFPHVIMIGVGGRRLQVSCLRISCSSKGSVDPAALQGQLFDLWSRKELEALRLQAVSGFSQLQDPLVGLLTMLESCPGIQKGRSSTLGQFIVTEFVRWRRSHPWVSLQGLKDDERLRLQLRALSLITASQSGYMDPLLDIYELSTLESSHLLDHVTYLQNCCYYREAALLSMKLELQKQLDMEQICVPLILLDKLPLAETYVRDHPELQKRLVRLLDSWCIPNFNLENVRRQYPSLSLSKHQTDQIQPKLLSRHVFRLMDKFSIDPSLCANSVHKRKLDSLKFLMYKRFKEKSMTEENWRDHVQVTVEGSVELQVLLVELLVHYCGLQVAAQWAKRYNIPRDRLPIGVWDTMQSLSAKQLEVNEEICPQESWITPQSHQLQYYQLPLARENVHFLQTLDQLELCKETVLEPGCVVGVDMEWRAGFGTVSTQRVALIQLAVEGQVFLLDLCAHSLSHHSLTVQFIRTVLTDKNILKLGYGMSGDFRSLVATWPELKEEPLEVKGVLDLLHVHQQLQRCWRGSSSSRSVEVSEGSAEKGLSLLVQQVLGKPLDKTEQLSNWERRPLRTGQLRYAAADAYCLLDVYLTLSRDPKAFGLPEDLCSISSSQPSKSVQQKKPKDKTKQHTGQRQARQRGDQPECVRGNSEQHAATIAPHELRVVCDNMLQGLGRFLRCLGVDVLMLENTDDHKVAAELARAEGRIILTSGQPYQSLKSQVAEGRCLTLDCSEKARDQAVRVLKHFHVNLTPSDIFSRCQVSVRVLDEWSGGNTEAVSRKEAREIERRSGDPSPVNHSFEVPLRNRPHEGGLRARRPVVGPVLTGQHRRARLAFATEHQNWQIRHRHLVLFTDESRFYLSTCDRRDRLWRRRGECYAACNIIQHDWFGGGSVMVWGGISLEGSTDLYRLDNGTLTAIRYQDKILGPVVRPSAGAVAPGILLVHNNARPHVVALQTVQELGDALVQIWEEIPEDTIRHLIRSMSVELCVHASLGNEGQQRLAELPPLRAWLMLSGGLGACNNNEYLKVSREEMTGMLNKRGLLQGNSILHNTQVPEGQRSPEAPVFNPHCRWASRSVLNPETLRFHGGAEIQLETVPPGLLPRIPEYFICTGCGKVFWEGTHYDRVLSQFQEVLQLSDGEVSSQS